jgi:hypothetical protein
LTEHECGLLRCRAIDARVQQPGPFLALVNALASRMHNPGIRAAFDRAADEATIAEVLESRHCGTDGRAHADLDQLMATIRQAGIGKWDRRIAKGSELVELRDQREAWCAFFDGRLVRCAYCGEAASDEIVRMLTPQLRQGQPLEAAGWRGRIVERDRQTHEYSGPRPVYACPAHRDELAS